MKLFLMIFILSLAGNAFGGAKEDFGLAWDIMNPSLQMLFLPPLTNSNDASAAKFITLVATMSPLEAMSFEAYAARDRSINCTIEDFYNTSAGRVKILFKIPKKNLKALLVEKAYITEIDSIEEASPYELNKSPYQHITEANLNPKLTDILTSARARGLKKFPLHLSPRYTNKDFIELMKVIRFLELDIKLERSGSDMIAAGSKYKIVALPETFDHLFSALVEIDFDLDFVAPSDKRVMPLLISKKTDTCAQEF